VLRLSVFLVDLIERAVLRLGLFLVDLIEKAVLRLSLFLVVDLIERAVLMSECALAGLVSPWGSRRRWRLLSAQGIPWPPWGW
jgi:hypothetical protein